ncbi:MAG: peptidoglycan binding domain-containing protein [Lachnospiraceae bacterium]|nr:peptidoglycan binding domain-containing protein [Lachnospiraceae bacterium]
MGYDDNDFENQLEKELDEFMGQQYGPVSDDPSSEYYRGDEEEDENYEDEEDYEKRRHVKKLIMTVVAVLVVLFLGAAGVYGGYAYYYSNKFFQGTTINGIDCSKLTVKEAEKLISKQVENYKLDVVFMNDETETIPGKNINYEFVSDGSIKKLKDSQLSIRWIAGVMGEKSAYKVDTNIKYSDAMLEHVLSDMPQMQDENMTAPSDAAMQYVNNQFTIVPEVTGNKLNKTKVLEAVKAAIADNKATVSIVDQGAYETPSVLKDDAALVAEVSQLNNLLGAAITYQLPNNQTQVLDGQVMMEWLKKAEDGTYSKDDTLWKQKLTDYVAELAKKVDTYSTDKTFDATSLGNITIKGDYGFQIDQEAELKQLTEELANKTITTRKPNYTHEALSYENNGFGKSYIEIDLSRQHLWFYIDGAVAVSTDIVSGLMTTDRYTPAGIFTLTFKKSPSVLRGEKRADGSYEYEAQVNYWMPFNGGIGMHDSTWRSSSDYGGTTYKGSGSHGCINMPLQAAKSIYGSITKEMPIICYYSEPYTLGASTKSNTSNTTNTTANTDDGPAPGGNTGSSGNNSGGNNGGGTVTETPVPTTVPTAEPTAEPTADPSTPEPTVPPATETPDAPTETPAA